MTPTHTSNQPDLDRSAHWSAGRAVAESSPAALVAAAVMSVAIVAMVATTGLTWPSGITIVALVPAVLVDVIDHRLPDRLVGAAAAIGVVSATVAVAAGRELFVVDVLIGVAALAGPLLIAHLVSPGSMGFGDVKFAVVLGAAVGFTDSSSALIALVLGCALATAHAFATRQRTIAFGPALLVGAVIALTLQGTDALTLAGAAHSTRTR